MELVCLLLAFYILLIWWLPPWLLAALLILDSVRPLREWPALRAWRGWRWLAARLYGYSIIDASGPRVRPRLYAVHPHGHLALSAFLAFAVGPYASHTVVAGHRFLLQAPLVRRVAAWLGVVDAGAATLLYALEVDGRDVALVLEGVHGMGPAARGLGPVRRRPDRALRLAWDAQKRLSLARDGTLMNPAFDLVPVRAHGERNVCWTWQPAWPPVLALRRWTGRVLRYPWPAVFVWPHPARRLPQLTTELCAPHAPRVAPDETFDAYAARGWRVLDAADA